MNVKTLKVQCPSCDGTGLYVGLSEVPGTAVVCIDCEGTGNQIMKFTPFTKRKEKPKITEVYLSAGAYIGTYTGAIGNAISYEDFKEGKMPH